MTRFTLLATAASLLAAPALADNHMAQSDSAQTTENQGSEQMAQGTGTEPEGRGQTMMDDGAQYASGTMSSDNQLQNMIRTSEIVGGDVYTVRDNEWTDEEWAELDMFDDIGDGWEDIGNITDVVLTPDGSRAGLVISHGGFLDIGDDTVLLTMDELRRVGSTEDVGGDYNYVTRLTQDEIEQMPEVEENWW
ncbi:PRC-barrel domain-containing protein [Rhodovulum sp. 12E13]|uniref:PRC-barrel domain-containing protein n=1 Tax=Rhodovulum sp. 12E13 TaxID=2203891 RepID=UPI001314A5B9|nr:PRC-barrel domain-containing protein [Rhodovulum sp. 12E13]